ncbi:MAG: hypothetical protein K2N01_07615 [Lachnospiraceae bacterium]|nr:hypothetical protein [Lachnospiraceae bacterium]
MKEIVTSGTICLNDEYDFTYYIADIRYTEREDESFCYEITPNYSVIDLLTDRYFQGIPGLDLSLKKKSYVRENVVPVFISERTPGENREDLWKLLEECDMQYLNRLEWLIRTKTRYSGDGMYVCRPDRRDLRISSIDELGNRSSIISRKVLEAICAGGKIVTNDYVIDDSNRKSYYELFMAMYRTERKYLDERRKIGISKSAKRGNYKGRSRIKLDKMELNSVFHEYEAGKMSSREAADILHISASTFFRRYREYKKMSQ